MINQGSCPRIGFLVVLFSVGALFHADSVWAGEIDVAVALKPRVEMEALAKSVLDPKSNRFRKFYSTDEIRKIAAPSDAQYGATLQELRSAGFLVTKESPSHLFVMVRAQRSALQRFQAKMLKEGDLGSSSSLVLGIEGMEASSKRRSHLRILPPERKGAQVMFPAMIKKLYGFDSIYSSGLTGKGQHIAIATYAGFNMDDIYLYYKKMEINPVPAVDQVIFNGTPDFDDLSALETQIDAEFSGMIAPGAAIHIFASAQNSDLGEYQVFNAILDDGRSKIVNYSWGDCETNLHAIHKQMMDRVFARAVAQGVNIMAASGDTGSSCYDGTPMDADYPSAHPYVVGIGGTTLSDRDGLASEVAWSGSGGGVSALFRLPHYQSDLGGTFSARAFPDIAFNADPATGEPGISHYGGVLRQITVGGTSIAAPQWSGFLALVGEARGGWGSIGFLNPVLYEMSDRDREDLLNDVVSGSNGGFSAGPGYDAVTGFGSMKAGALLQMLRDY